MAVDGTQTAFLLELAFALRLAGSYAPGSPPAAEVFRDLSALLTAMSQTGIPEADLRVTDESLEINGSALSFREAAVAGLWEHLSTRRIARLRIPAPPPTDELWKMLCLVGGPPEHAEASGGMMKALATAGCTHIQVEERPAGARRPRQTNPWAEVDDFGDPSRTLPLADLSEEHELSGETPMDQEPVREVEATPASPWDQAAEEIERSEGDFLSGDTVQARLSDDEKLSVTERITREVIRDKRPEGPEPAAAALIQAWQRVSLAQQGNDLQRGFHADVVTAIERLDPALRATVIFALANGPNAQRRLTEQLGAQYIAEALVEGLLAPLPHFVARAPAVLLSVKDAAHQRAIREVVDDICARMGPDRRSMWENVKSRSQ